MKRSSWISRYHCRTHPKWIHIEEEAFAGIFGLITKKKWKTLTSLCALQKSAVSWNMLSVGDDDDDETLTVLASIMVMAKEETTVIETTDRGGDNE